MYMHLVFEFLKCIFLVFRVLKNIYVSTFKFSKYFFTHLIFRNESFIDAN